jgi:hypothetical protein
MTEASLYQPIFYFFTSLCDVRFNFWPYLFFLLPPLLIFSVRPNDEPWLRAMRTIVAVGCAYILINLSLHTHRSIIWRAYQTCQSQYPDGAIQHHDECGEINIADGASIAFYLLLGWLPGAAYVGIWELIWRRFHRHQLAERRTPLRWAWITSFPVWVFYVCLALPVISIVIVLFQYVRDGSL